MYYSKSNGNTINIPRNYSGNTFRVIDETERSRAPLKEINPSIEIHRAENNFDKNIITEKEQSTNCEHSQNKSNSSPPLPSALSGISLEDLLLLGLIFVIHQENPNDSTLLLLLILLLAK